MAERHILSVDDFSRNDLRRIFSTADAARSQPEDFLHTHEGQVLATLFFEPSTRTRLSFEAAMARLGGKVLTLHPESSSLKKGESEAHTVWTASQYADILVTRTSQEGQVTHFAEISRVPVINGGDGSGEHPTQALLDVYTILREFGELDGLTVAMVGDLKFGRTVHSLTRLLNRLSKNIRYTFCSAEGLEMPGEITSLLDPSYIETVPITNLRDVMPDTDVLYVTRVQRERFPQVEGYEALRGTYLVDESLISHMRSDGIVMHPLPSTWELADYFGDQSHHLRIENQMRNGMFVRMGLLDITLL